MSDAGTCGTCGRPIPADAPGGACPRCALADALPVADAGPTADEVAAKLPAFEILGILGRGGMGVVFKARQRALDRIVALKVLPPASAAAPGFADRFHREAKAMARLAHPNIVSVYEFGEAGGLFYLVLEFVDGVNVREAMAAGRMRPDDALTIVPQVCDALQYAHDRGVVHRDIKPENVLIGRDGRVKIADFGLAKLADREAGDPSLTGAGQVMGTLRYMAPEQWERPKEVDHRADIYSLGVVFYEMLTGELPVGKFEPPSSRAHMDVRIDDVVMRAIERDRERRWQQASEVKTRMGEIASGAAVARPADPPTRVARRMNTVLVRDRTPPSRTAVAIAVGCGIALAVVAWTQFEGVGRYAGVLLACLVASIPWLTKFKTEKVPDEENVEPETPEENLATAASCGAGAVIAAVAAIFSEMSWLWWWAGPLAVGAGWYGAIYWARRPRGAASPDRPSSPPTWLSPWMRGFALAGGICLMACFAWALQERVRAVADGVGSLAIVLGIVLLVLTAIRASQWRRVRASGGGALGPAVGIVVFASASLLLALFCLVHSLASAKRELPVEQPVVAHKAPRPARRPKTALDDRDPWKFQMEVAEGENPVHQPTERDRQDIFKIWSRAQALQGDQWSEDRAGLYDDDDRKAIEAMGDARRMAASVDGSLGLPYLDRKSTTSPLSRFRIDRVRFGVWTGSTFESATAWASDGAATLRFQLRRGYYTRGGSDMGWFFAASPVEIR